MILNFSELCKKYSLDIKGVLHIGAHYGQEYIEYKKHNINKIMFFEPLKKNYEELCKRVPNEENIYFVNKALGNDNKIIEMFVEDANFGQSSSILKPKLHLEQYSHIIFNNKEQVEMVKLDDYLKNNCDYNFINIDVQGYELEVFKGAEKTLNNIDYIISEVNRAELYENNVTVNDLDEYLEKFNFRRVETNWIGVTWGDALYIKEKI